MKKCVLSLLLALCLIIGLIPAVEADTAASGSFGEGGGLTWVLTDDGTLTISGSGSMGEFSSDGSDRPWHSYVSYINRVIIRPGVTNIGSWAFLDCSNLTDASIADSVTLFDYGAFENCVKLSTIAIPDSVTHVCCAAFYNCDSLTRITLPAHADICDSPFDSCDNLKAIYVAEGNPYFTSDNGVLLNIDKTRLIQCPGGFEGSYVIPNTVTDVYLDAFNGCTKLTEITIPANFGEDPPIFSDCASLSSVHFAEGTTAVGGFHSGCYNLQEITIPESVTTILPFAFSGTCITNITIPSDVTRIGEYALACHGLETVTFTGDAPEVYSLYNELDGNDVIPWAPSPIIAYYPANNPSWTQEARDAISTVVTWVAHNPDNPFTDVPAGSFYEEPVLWALENGITNGATENTFNPNGQCLRAHVVTFLHRAAENPEPSSTNNPFTDVKATDFFYKPVLWAVEKNITNGISADKFGSYDVCNRAAVVTFLWRSAGCPEPESAYNPFVDVKPSDFFYKAVLWAVENGITNGLTSTEFGPNSPCNRAQVVTFLYRAYN